MASHRCSIKLLISLKIAVVETTIQSIAIKRVRNEKTQIDRGVMAALLILITCTLTHISDSDAKC